MIAQGHMIRSLLLAGAASLTLSFTMASTSVAAPEAIVEAATEAPVALWSAASLADLRAEVAASAGDGLEPAAYGVEALDGRSPGADTDRIATAIATALASDYARGSIDDPTKLDWHIARPAADLNVPLTFGSDAHAPGEVGMAFTDAIKLAKESGYTHWRRFKQRKSESVRL